MSNTWNPCGFVGFYLTGFITHIRDLKTATVRATEHIVSFSVQTILMSDVFSHFCTEH